MSNPVADANQEDFFAGRSEAVSRYSTWEQQIFTRLGWKDLLSVQSVTPPDLYRTVAVDCFTKKDTSPEAEAVRVGLEAFRKNLGSDNYQIHRGTPEWEQMLQDAVGRGW